MHYYTVLYYTVSDFKWLFVSELRFNNLVVFKLSGLALVVGYIVDLVLTKCCWHLSFLVHVSRKRKIKLIATILCALQVMLVNVWVKTLYCMLLNKQNRMILCERSLIEYQMPSFESVHSVFRKTIEKGHNELLPRPPSFAHQWEGQRSKPPNFYSHKGSYSTNRKVISPIAPSWLIELCLKIKAFS